MGRIRLLAERGLRNREGDIGACLVVVDQAQKRPGGDCVNTGIARDLENEVVAVAWVILSRVVAGPFAFVVCIVSFAIIVNGNEDDRPSRCALARWNNERGQR